MLFWIKEETELRLSQIMETEKHVLTFARLYRGGFVTLIEDRRIILTDDGMHFIERAEALARGEDAIAFENCPLCNEPPTIVDEGQARKSASCYFCDIQRIPIEKWNQRPAVVQERERCLHIVKSVGNWCAEWPMEVDVYQERFEKIEKDIQAG